MAITKDRTADLFFLRKYWLDVLPEVIVPSDAVLLSWLRGYGQLHRVSHGVYKLAAAIKNNPRLHQRMASDPGHAARWVSSRNTAYWLEQDRSKARRTPEHLAAIAARTRGTETTSLLE